MRCGRLNAHSDAGVEHNAEPCRAPEVATDKNEIGALPCGAQSRPAEPTKPPTANRPARPHATRASHMQKRPCANAQRGACGIRCSSTVWQQQARAYKRTRNVHERLDCRDVIMPQRPLQSPISHVLITVRGMRISATPPHIYLMGASRCI